MDQAYKPDVVDAWEGPALDIIRLLEERGALVSFHDPFVESLRDEGLDTPAAALSAETVAGADGVVIATHHTSYDWAWLQTQARLIVDTRHVLPQAGFQTAGIDLDPRKIEALTAGRSTIEDVPTAEVGLLVAAGRLRATAASASWPSATRSRSACRRL